MGFLTWIGLVNTSKPLELGDSAPEITTQDEEGNPVRSSQLYHTGYTLIYFFPKADTPGCTAQACSLRDEFEELTRRGVRIIGVSNDSAPTQQRFKQKHHLPFTFLSDEDRRLAQAFGVPTLLGMTHRQSFLIREGKLVWRDLSASTRRQARDVINVLNTLDGAKPT